MFTITGITSIVLAFIVSFKELLPKDLPKNRKRQWWQKGVYSCPLKVIFDGSLCILCTAFLQKLYCPRESHGMMQFVLKIPDLSILMEPILFNSGKGVTMFKVWITCRYVYQSALNIDQHEPNTKEVLGKALKSLKVILKLSQFVLAIIPCRGLPNTSRNANSAVSLAAFPQRIFLLRPVYPKEVF